ncbi:HTH-type transcriptional regulator RafR [Pseudovibrio axinellae]|uniref:HTH-type transcriptional regulator RafR n=1 Tax=Pseudovibrio axinellae TaxID=989403 RepID=A0A165XRN7_9HYPH|nr:substrate-binding domain-containing protein [Pseudovibrio axinellae]KZL17975.1 HTH-type transcriptional regulator RafR [Pseudovibrio axinellae]SER14777.1 transcriptional regulator, LacI family [Pseudovibrio axinellae]
MNLKTLASHLGLSQTTVSRALNGYTDVSLATRNRVAEAAKNFGYRPNVNARRLATGRSSVIGIAFPTDMNMFLDPHFIEFLAGLSEKASQLDYDIMISSSQNDEVDVYRRFAEKGTVDLVILSNVDLSEERIRLLQDLNIPFIVHGRTATCDTYSYIDINNYSVFHDPTKMLLELGHEKIAILNGHPDRVYAIERFHGWQDALNERGITPNPDYVRSGVMSEENGYSFAMEVLQLGERPTALLCSSVIMAKGAYKACSDLDIKVGSDISILAHDDSVPLANATEMDPPLTVTRSPLRDAGREIAIMAMKYLKGTDIKELQCLWQPELIFRKSVAAPPRDDI